MTPTFYLTPEFVIVLDCREIYLVTGTDGCETRGYVSDLTPEITRHILRLRTLYPTVVSNLPSHPKHSNPLSRSDAVKILLIGATSWKVFGKTEEKEQVFDYTGRYSSVRYPNDDWEEFSHRELENFMRRGKLVRRVRTEEAAKHG